MDIIYYPHNNCFRDEHHLGIEKLIVFMTMVIPLEKKGLEESCGNHHMVLKNNQVKGMWA